MPKLYGINLSPPYRSVQLTAKVLGIKLKEISVNMFALEHLTPEFKKLNPQRSIPTFEDDDGFIVYDSHAICAYLVSKYGSGNTEHLYPKNLKTRSLIDSRLHFDTELYTFTKSAMVQVLFKNFKKISEENEETMKIGCRKLNNFLALSPWLAGENLTIADLCTINTVDTLNIFVDINKDKYPCLFAWLENCRNLPYYDEICGQTVKDSRKLLQKKLDSKL